MTENKITKAKETALAKMDYGVDESYDSGIKTEDMKIPAILLIQSQSDFPEWEQMKQADRPVAGDFYNPITQDVYRQEDGFEALVTDMFVQVGIKKTGAGERGYSRFSRDGIVWDDTGAQITPEDFEWDGDDGSKAAQKIFNFLVLPKGSLMPAVIKFRSTSAKNAKALNFQLRYAVPTLRAYTKFTSAEATNDKGKFFVIHGLYQPTNHLLDQATANIALQLHDASRGTVVEVVDATEEVDYGADASKETA